MPGSLRLRRFPVESRSVQHTVPTPSNFKWLLIPSTLPSVMYCMGPTKSLLSFDMHRDAPESQTIVKLSSNAAVHAVGCCNITLVQCFELLYNPFIISFGLGCADTLAFLSSNLTGSSAWFDLDHQAM